MHKVMMHVVLARTDLADGVYRSNYRFSFKKMVADGLVVAS